MSGFMGLTPVQVPDFGATLGRAQQYQQNQLLALAQARELQQGRALDAALNQYGEAAARGDTNALAALARSGAQGARIAFPLVDQQQRRQMLGQLIGQGAPAAEPAVPSQAAGGSGGDFYGDLASAESGGDPNARNARSSATGAYQFIDGTWLQFARENPDLFRGMSDAQILAARSNPGLSRKAAEWYAAKNSQALTAAGVQPTPAALALSHRFDGPVAAKILQAPPETPIASIVGEAAMRANPDLANKTTGQVVAQAQQRFGGGAAPDAGPDFSAQLRQVDVLRRRAQAAALVGGESGKVLAEQLNQQANALERRIEAERVRADNPPPTVQLGAGPWGEAGVYERLRGGGYRRIGAVPPPTTLIQNQPESIRAAADRETLKAVTEGANQARTVLALFDRAEQAARRAPDGYGAQFAPIFGQVARTFGINMPGTSDAEVLQGLTTQLATLQRAPGSGATSDFEMGLYMRSVPQLGQTAQGRQQLIEMGRALARRKIEEARIWRQHAGAEDLMDRLDALGPVFTEAQTKFLEGANAEPTQPPQGGIPGPGGMGTAEPPPPPAGFRVIR